MLTFTWTVNGTDTDVLTAKFSDPTGAYGMRRVDTHEIVLADGTDWDHSGTGVYSFDETELDLEEGIEYEYWEEVLYDNEYTRQRKTFTIPEESETLGQKLIRFVAIQDGEYLDLETSPKLAAPTSNGGLFRLDDGSVVVANNTPYIADGTLYSYAFTPPALDLKYRYYVKVVKDSITYYVARTTQFQNDANLLIGRYTDSTRIEKMFGSDNVHKWSAVDDGDSCIDYAMRQFEHIVAAEQQIDDMLKGYYITEPFVISEDTPTIPRVIIDQATALAGCLMYEMKGTIDLNSITGDPQHKYSMHRRRVADVCRRIKYGTLKLDVSTTPSIPVAGYKLSGRYLS